jgi:hypothetical protein
MKNLWVSLLILLSLTGCGPSPLGNEQNGVDTSTPPNSFLPEPLLTPFQERSPQGEIPTMPPLQRTPTVPNLQDLIEKAKDDLARRLSISMAHISLLEARDVVWPNSSLGCPQPGMLYADVLTPGFLILLSADNQEYEYHAGKGSDVFYCENPLPPVEGLPSNT